MLPLSPDHIAACRTDLMAFSKHVFKAKSGGGTFQENWHHSVICEALGMVAAGHTPLLIINMPPRHSKTLLSVVYFIAWTMGQSPDSEFVHTSYSKKVASTNCFEVRELMLSEEYQQIFPNVHLMNDSKARDEFRTTQGGLVYASGAEGSLTGFGGGKLREEGDTRFGGCIIVDDPHKPKEANSDHSRNEVLDWYHSTLQHRRNSATAPLILVMQRLHEEDLSGYLLEQQIPGCVHLKIPAMGTEETIKTWPQMGIGEALWPQMATAETHEKTKRQHPYTFYGQFMQEPTPPGGGIFKDHWWQWYNPEVPPRFEFKIITADTAMKTKQHNDYTVIQCWGKWDGKAYLIDQIRGKWEAPELKRRFIAFWIKHYGSGTATSGRLRCAYIEDKASGTGLIQEIKRAGNIPIKAVQRNIDKVSRANDSVDCIESGLVWLPEGLPWISDYLTEFNRFTADNKHKNDDQIDPTLDAIKILLQINKIKARVWNMRRR